MTLDAFLLGAGWILGSLALVTVCLFIARSYGAVAIIGLYPAVYVISSVLANKFIVFLWWVVPAGTIVFSITFLLTDMLSEFYGRTAARRAVWLGFLAQVILIFSISIAIRWSTPSFWHGQEAFAATLGNTWRIALASIGAYLLSQHHDVWAYHFWKTLTKDRHLWLRNNFSTVVSQAIDSSVFVVIAFWGIVPILSMIKGVLAVKILIALLDTPFMYFARWVFARSSGSGAGANTEACGSPRSGSPTGAAGV